MIPRLALLAIVAIAAVRVPLDPEERQSAGSLPAYVAGAFEELAACHLGPSGEYLLFDSRAHAVYTYTRGAAAAVKIVQIGAEPGRILRPSSFDSAPDGTFVVTDAPLNQPRIQFFRTDGLSFGGFTMPGREVPQITFGEAVLSGIGSAKYTGNSVLVSQPEVGALVTEYEVTGATRRTFGELRATGQERDPAVHLALNAGLVLPIPKGGYFYVFLSGVPMFRKYDGAGKLVFERHIEGVELDSYEHVMPTTWPRRSEGGREIPIVPAMLRAAGVDPDGNLWISTIAPYTYVYDASGDKRRVLQFRGAGIVTPTSFFFTKDHRVLLTPGCYAFDARL
jgi:hypothetical protein